MSKKNHLFYVATVMTGLLGICSPAFGAISRLTIDSGTISRSTGVVTVNGTITCTAGDAVYLSANVTQVIANRYGQAYGSPATNPITCIGNNEPWTITMTQSYGYPIQPGFVAGNAQAYDGSDGTSVSAASKLHLKLVP
jgi:hypothetical protein